MAKGNEMMSDTLQPHYSTGYPIEDGEFIGAAEKVHSNHCGCGGRSGGREVMGVR